MICTCGHPDDYNYAINNGLCNSCIAEKLDELETENKRLREQQFKPASKCITPGCGGIIDINYCAQCRKDWAS